MVGIMAGEQGGRLADVAPILDLLDRIDILVRQATPDYQVTPLIERARVMVRDLDTPTPAPKPAPAPSPAPEPKPEPAPEPKSGVDWDSSTGRATPKVRAPRANKTKN